MPGKVMICVEHQIHYEVNNMTEILRRSLQVKIHSLHAFISIQVMGLYFTINRTSKNTKHTNEMQMHPTARQQCKTDSKKINK